MYFVDLQAARALRRPWTAISRGTVILRQQHVTSTCCDRLGAKIPSPEYPFALLLPGFSVLLNTLLPINCRIFLTTFHHINTALFLSRLDFFPIFKRHRTIAMAAPTTPTFKLVLVGDGGTGKASTITLILLFTLINATSRSACILRSLDGYYPSCGVDFFIGPATTRKKNITQC